MKHIPAIVVLRVITGWYFLYAGLTKVFDPAWSAAGYLHTAKSFPAFYAWLASPGLLPAVNFLNAWGLTLLGIALIIGVCLRISTWLGTALMALYYLPALSFPFVDHGFIVDIHIFLIAIMAVLREQDGSREYGLVPRLRRIRSIRSSKVIAALLR